MIKYLRAISLFILLIFITFASKGQDISNAIVHDYNRNSISEMYLRYSDSYNSYIQNWFEKHKASDKFDINNIPIKYINISGSRTYDKEDKLIVPNRTSSITKYLNDNNVGLDIVSYIFNRDASGKMDLGRVHERGLYTASDVDVRLSSVKVRGLFEIEDLGHELINNSYIIVYDFVNVFIDSDGSDDDFYKGQVSAYLFNIQWSSEIEAMIFDAWIDDDTPQDQIAAKKKAYDDIHIPVKCVMRATKSSVSVIDDDHDFNSWLNQAMNDISHEIQKKYSGFAVKTAITNVKPIRAKIGLKEGLKPGLRFYVYDNVMKNGGEIVKARRGILRATNIVDNRHIATGANPESDFRQVAGRKLQTGQSLMEKRDLGFSVGVGYCSTLLHGAESDSFTGNMGGFHFDVAYEIFLKSQLFTNYAMVSCNIEGAAFNVAISYNFGLSINNFELLPFVGIGIDNYTAPDASNFDDTLDDKLSAWYIQGGIRTHITIYYPVQLFAACEWNQIISHGDLYDEYSGTIRELDKDGKNVEYKFRKLNGLHAYGGIRICF